ncbi:MAG TPA: permease prefix domain 1-containing protein [Pseudolysinimonas sp.]
MEQQLDTQIGAWRSAILKSRAVTEADADELEEHLREQITELEGTGLNGDEAFLIAVGRLGKVDAVTAEFAREHSDRLWKQLATSRPDEGGTRSLVLVIGLAVLAAALVQTARVLAGQPGPAQFLGEPTAPWFARDLSLFVLPVLAAYFAVVRRMPWQRTVWLAAVVAVLAIAVNVFPFADDSATGVLVGIHLPVALWFVVGAAYVGGEVRSSTKRMDFIRFTGEWAIYYALIALGGAVLLGLTTLVLEPIAPDALEDVITWVLPSGAAGAVLVAAWLVEAKKSVVENLAPVLTAIFTPLFAAMLLASATVYAIAGVGRDFDRNLLTVFDVLLLVVLGLIVYGISARDSSRRAGLMDVIRLVAVVAAIVLDVLVLVSMFARIGEFGFTANRVAALGLNLILLVNLAGTAWFIGRLLAGRGSAVRLERWQTDYLPVFAAWVVVVLLALPPIFGFA